LNSQSGDADLYIRLQENSNLIKKTEWQMPSLQTYDYKSELSLTQDIA